MSTPEQIILHAGLPKTGTTYLQRCFVANRRWLADRGVCYPEVGQEHQFGHHNLALRLDGQPARDVERPDVPPEELLGRALRTDCRRVLLSSEEFGSLSAAGAELLGRALAGREVQVAVFLRRRSRMCVSAWQERVKHGSPAAFLEYVAEQLLGASARVLRPEHTLEPIHARFGKAAMRVVVYDHLVEDGVDLFEFFVRAILGLEVDEALAGRGQASNPSVEPAVLEVVRAVNEARLLRGEAPGIEALEPLLRHLREDADGRELVARVAGAIARHGEDLDLRALDGEWLDRDRHVRTALGECVLNAADERELFRREDAATFRILRPSRLYGVLPPEVFADLLDRLPHPG